MSIEHLLNHSLNKITLIISLFLSLTIFYTVKIDILSVNQQLKDASISIFALSDLIIVCSLFFATYLALRVIVYPLLDKIYLSQNICARLPSQRMLTIFFIICWFPFLLVFYPSAGMNDSMAILRNGFSCINQFPWLYVAVVKPVALISKYFFRSYEPAIFLLSLIQMVIMSYGLAYCSRFIGKELNNYFLSWLLALYFAFFPMVGNYAVAFVRDPLYSLGLLLLTLFLFQIQNKQIWLRKNCVEFFCLSIAMMGLCQGRVQFDPFRRLKVTQ